MFLIHLSWFVLALVSHLVATSELPKYETYLQANSTDYYNNTRIQLSEKANEKTGEWTFDIVEHDLLDYLENLRGRNKLNESAAVNEGSSAAKGEWEKSTHLPANRAANQSEGDSPVQYGIFDRLTRLRNGITTSTTSKPNREYQGDFNVLSLNVDDYNSEECGLRTYDSESDIIVPIPTRNEKPPRSDYVDDDNASDQQHKMVLTPALPKVRQRLTHSELERKRHQLESLTKLMRQREEQLVRNRTVARRPSDQPNALSSTGEVDEIFNRFRDHPSRFDPFDTLTDADQIDEAQKAGHDEKVKESETTSDFHNLELKRRWLQQQLSQTLELLGYNSSSSGPTTDEDPPHMREEFDAKAKKSKRLGKSQQELPVSILDDMNLEARVIGGSDARLGDSPWSVSLQALVTKPSTGGYEYRHFCGGSIISEHHILTAAHCLDFMVGRESRLFIVLGDTNWRLGPNSVSGRRITVDKLIIHIGYKSTAFAHDIGMIRTREQMRPVKIGGRYLVNSVCLPRRGAEHSGEAELAGWGLFSQRNEMADSLQVASVPILPRASCVDLYRRRTGLLQWLIGIELITEKQLCAGTFGRGICQGDSGSGLVVYEKPAKPLPSSIIINHGLDIEDNLEQRDSWDKKLLMRQIRESRKQARATIIGTVAFGGIRRCSYQSLPGVYMQTSKYCDFILKNLV